MTNRYCKDEENFVLSGTSLEEEAIYRLAIQNLYGLVLIMEPNAQLQKTSKLNTAFGGLIPTDSQQMIDAIHPESQLRVIRGLLQLDDNGKTNAMEFRYRSAENADVWLWVEANRLVLPKSEDGGMQRLAIILKDITDRKRYEEDLLHMSFHDPLTDLPNRRLFNDRLIQSMAYAKRNKKMIAVLCVDIDDFKVINDTKGHDVGDEFLKAFALRVKDRIREVDTFARIGGDEFWILLNSIDSEASVELVTKRLHDALQKEWNVGPHTFNASASIGAAIFPWHGEDPVTLQKHVDIALYHVKSGGRNGYRVYDPSMGSRHPLEKKA